MFAGLKGRREKTLERKRRKWKEKMALR